LGGGYPPFLISIPLLRVSSYNSVPDIGLNGTSIFKIGVFFLNTRGGGILYGGVCENLFIFSLKWGGEKINGGGEYPKGQGGEGV